MVFIVCLSWYNVYGYDYIYTKCVIDYSDSVCNMYEVSAPIMINCAIQLSEIEKNKYYLPINQIGNQQKCQLAELYYIGIRLTVPYEKSCDKMNK